MPRNVYLAQVNSKFGSNVFLPHSVGMLQAYAQAQPDLAGAYEFAPLIFLREDPEKLAASMVEPDVIGISAYVWNWEWSKAFAQAVRRHHPRARIIMGGPQVPERDEGFFREHPYVDAIVHHEGEIAFSEILRLHLADGRDHIVQLPAGTSFAGHDGKTYHGPPAERPMDLSVLPSPYLSGVYEPLLAAHPDLEFHATQETHRGCPYSCTFCDWGSATFQKVRRFPIGRIVEEFEWMGRHKIELLYNADANFGLFPDDEDLVRQLILTKKHYGFPKQIRAAWAKNSNERVFHLAKLLNEAGMDKGVTLARQSMDEGVLQVIKRKNIPMSTFRNLVKQYTDAGIPTYTEIIMGLPGETYDSFADGIDTVLSAGQHNGLNIYILAVLPNAEMADPAYAEEWGLQTVRSPILQQHSTPRADPITEYNEIVVGTRTMPPNDWLRTYMFSWAVQTFHTLGLLQDVAIYLHDHRGVSYRAFYEELVLGCNESFGPASFVASREYQLAYARTTRGMSGGEWGQVDERFGNVVWPTEEFSFLRIVCLEMDRFYIQIAWWLEQRGWQVPPEVILQQKESMRTPAEFGGDWQEYSRRVVWYGRKGGLFRKVNREAAS